jgi:hypothetical protein
MDEFLDELREMFQELGREKFSDADKEKVKEIIRVLFK